MTVLTRGAYGNPGTSLAFKTGNWRSTEKPVHVHLKAPCHAACPAGEDQQAWFAELQAGHVEAAWTTLVTANPLPGITGRVCPHPCEGACNRAAVDGALAIHNVERWLGDEAVTHGWAYPVGTPEADAPSVAIVGGGPAGLSAAYHAVRHGLRAKVFEALPAAGGLLRSAIPQTRLPRSVLDAELDRLLALEGIEVQYRTRLGRDVSVSELEQQYSAVLLAPGCQESREWDVRGAVPAEHHEGLALLKEFMDHGQFPSADRVVVCRLLKRSGVEHVTLVTASGLPGPNTEPDDLINVVPRELDEALEEGIDIVPHATVNRLIMRGSKVIGAEVAGLKKERDRDGRMHRVTFEGTERVVDVDMVIPCIGERVDPAGLSGLVQRGFLRPTDTRGTLKGMLFSLGDARGDRGTVAEAIGDGKRAIEAVVAKLAGDEVQDDDRPSLDATGLNLAYYESRPKALAPKLAVAERSFDTDGDGDIGRAAAMDEAQRCLSCGNCLACDNCWTFCPDSAVIKTVELATDGSHYLFDLDYCKGCGLCAHECPTGYIQMQAE